MPLASFHVGNVQIGGGPLAVIAGPCVIETKAQCLEIGAALRDACARLGLGYVFKASFDKANRTSIRSYRGPGLAEGLRILASVRERLRVPVLTDIHEPAQAAPAAECVDMLQIPAFLARQTDLLLAAAATGCPVNVKKAQFAAPGDMRAVIGKLESAGCERILLTERGAAFGYHNLVVDFRSLPIMRSLGCPVCYDVTHSVQSPGGLGNVSGATREYAPHLARAAVAVGVDALFLEAHPDPANALSDAAAQLPLAEVPALLETVARLSRTLSERG
ncbi:MAG: 3-deoxy-8-phosphooctulonate synthase [Armatimonadetes bacterium]|nr:3-deoxy-8-phosphooctulonate synthase [Armatimonadota bacterium]